MSWEVATKEDLLDMLIADSESCVGVAANMIGVRKCIIAFLDENGARINLYSDAQSRN